MRAARPSPCGCMGSVASTLRFLIITGCREYETQTAKEEAEYVSGKYSCILIILWALSCTVIVRESFLQPGKNDINTPFIVNHLLLQVMLNSAHSHS